MSAPILTSAQHMHMEFSQTLNISNELNNNLANFQKKDKEFYVDEYVMIKKFFARKAGPSKIMKSNGPNAYIPEISPNLCISSTFIILDLIESKEPAVIPSESIEPVPFFVSEPTPKQSHIILPFGEEKIERTLDDQAISTWDGDYQHNLVRWQGRLKFENLWNDCMDLKRLNPYPP